MTLFPDTLGILKGSTRTLKSTRHSMASGARITVDLLKGCNGCIAQRLDAAAQVQGFQLCVPTQAAQCRPGQACTVSEEQAPERRALRFGGAPSCGCRTSARADSLNGDNSPGWLRLCMTTARDMLCRLSASLCPLCISWHQVERFSRR